MTTTNTTTERQYFATSEKITVDSYPYGRLRTSATFGLEFKPGKGFRTTFQTVNPKNGRLNAVKNSTYSPILVMYREQESGHIKYMGFDFYGSEGINKAAKFMAENFDLFTEEQVKDICSNFFAHIKATAKAMVIYCGSNFDNIKPILEESVNASIEGLKTGGNVFSRINLDIEALEACKVEGYNPFTVKSYTIG